MSGIDFREGGVPRAHTAGVALLDVCIQGAEGHRPLIKLKNHHMLTPHWDIKAKTKQYKQKLASRIAECILRL